MVQVAAGKTKNKELIKEVMSQQTWVFHVFYTWLKYVSLHYL